MNTSHTAYSYNGGAVWDEGFAYVQPAGLELSDMRDYRTDNGSSDDTESGFRECVGKKYSGTNCFFGAIWVDGKFCSGGNKDSANSLGIWECLYPL